MTRKSQHRILKAFALAGTLWSTESSAYNVIPDFPPDFAVETNTIIQIAPYQHCIAAADLNPTTFPHHVAPKSMSLIADLIEDISQTDLGRLIVENNKSSDVNYCVVDAEYFDNTLNGAYAHDNKTVYLSYRLNDTYATTFTIMAEEVSHAMQWHTNPILVSIDKREELKLFDIYTFGLGVEAQAKIWSAQIWHQFNTKNPDTPLALETDDTPDHIVMHAAQQCFVKYNIANPSCLREAFTEIMTRDNPYTDSNQFQVYSRIFAHLINQSTRFGMDLPSSDYARHLGYIPTSGGNISFLPKDFDVRSLYRHGGETPRQGHDRSWRAGNYMRLIDGDLDQDGANPIRHTP